MKEKDFPLHGGAFALGEVSFHGGWTFHRAGANLTDRPTAVMTIIYIDGEMRLAEPQNANQRNDWQSWCPGAEIGKLIDTPLNPLLYSGRSPVC